VFRCLRQSNPEFPGLGGLEKFTTELKIKTRPFLVWLINAFSGNEGPVGYIFTLFPVLKRFLGLIDIIKQIIGVGKMDTILNKRSPKLLDQVREVNRRKHYRIRTEHAYADWVKRFILFHHKRHPQELGKQEITAFLNHLAVDRKVAASTQNQNNGIPSSADSRYRLRKPG